MAICTHLPRCTIRPQICAKLRLCIHVFIARCKHFGHHLPSQAPPTTNKVSFHSTTNPLSTTKPLDQKSILPDQPRQGKKHPNTLQHSRRNNPPYSTRRPRAASRRSSSPWKHHSLPLTEEPRSLLGVNRNNGRTKCPNQESLLTPFHPIENDQGFLHTAGTRTPLTPPAAKRRRA